MTDRNGQSNDAVRWLFEDRRTGKIVVGQTPNLPLILFICAFAADAALRPRGMGGLLLRGVKVSSLSYWALDEIVRGVNPFRRIGGAGVLAYLVASRIG